MSTFVIYNRDSLKVYDTATNRGAATILHDWYLLRTVDVAVDETELSVSEWEMWKALTK